MQTKTLDFIPIKTRIVNPPKDEIFDIIDNLEIHDGDIVFITSKILGIHQGRCVPIEGNDKIELIKQEATHYKRYHNPLGSDMNLTITDNILICASGIDESNANGHYIMWPKETDKLCREIRERLCKRTGVKRLGVISTDSASTPLRWGVLGITTGLSGVAPLKDIRGHEDLFGRKMKMARINQIDPLTGMAVLIMGEAAEQTPILILRGHDGIEFDENGSREDMKISPEEDFFRPMLDVLK